jgi:hypothetical protein
MVRASRPRSSSIRARRWARMASMVMGRSTSRQIGSPSSATRAAEATAGYSADCQDRAGSMKVPFTPLNRSRRGARVVIRTGPASSDRLSVSDGAV